MRPRRRAWQSMAKLPLARDLAEALSPVSVQIFTY
jgi:hypothetical protein